MTPLAGVRALAPACRRQLHDVGKQFVVFIPVTAVREQQKTGQ